MAKPSGLSFHPKDAIVGGGIGLGPGKAKVVKARFGQITYKNKSGVATRKPTTALLLTLKRGDEKAVESYTVGEGFKPSGDGKSLVPMQSQSGLQDSCKTMRLFKSMHDHGMPDTAYDDLVKDISGLEGLIAIWARKTMPKIDRKGKPGGSSFEPTIFLVDEIIKSPWELDEKRGAKAEDDDEAEDEGGDEEEDEAADDEEEEDEKPAKKAKGKKKPVADDDDDSDESEDEDDSDEKDDSDEESDEDESDDTDEDVAEEAAEKLLDALEDGDLKKSKIQDAVTAAAKKDKATKAKASAIGKFAASDALLKKEQGWSWDGKVAKKD